MTFKTQGRVIKGLVVCNCWLIVVSTFGPAKRSGPRLLSPVPWGYVSYELYSFDNADMNKHPQLIKAVEPYVLYMG